jgi:hypothetical protein
VTEPTLRPLDRMNPRARELWLAALRSDDYVQGKHHLTTLINGVRRYCCLGVLCEVARLGGVPLTVVDQGSVRFYDDEDNYPPPAVLRWAGLPDRNPAVDVGDTVRVGLSLLNDERSYTLAQVADLVEEQL